MKRTTSNDPQALLKHGTKMYASYSTLINELEVIRSRTSNTIRNIARRSHVDTIQKDFESDVTKTSESIHTLEKNVRLLHSQGQPVLTGEIHGHPLEAVDLLQKRRQQKQLLEATKLKLISESKTLFKQDNEFDIVGKKSIHPRSIESVLSELDSIPNVSIKKIFDEVRGNTMDIEGQRPKLRQLNVALDEILCVYIQVNEISNSHLQIEHVTVFGSKEVGEVWGTSKLKQFQVITCLANEALGYFQAHYPDKLAYYFIKWICKYSTLFAGKCKKCSRNFVETENGPMLPLFRSFEVESKDCYHLECLNM